MHHTEEPTEETTIPAWVGPASYVAGIITFMIVDLAMRAAMS